MKDEKYMEEGNPRGIRYKSREGDWVVVTDRKDPRINFQGYLESVTPVQIEVCHICENGNYSLVTLANQSNLVMGGTSEEEIRNWREDNIKKFKRRELMRNRGKEKII